MITEGDIIMDHLCEEYFPVLDELYEDGINNRKEGPHTFRSLVENLVGDSDINDTEACRVVDAWWTNKNKLKPGNEQISEAIKHDILTRLNDGSHHYNKADIDMDEMSKIPIINKWEKLMINCFSPFPNNEDNESWVLMDKIFYME